MKSGNYEILRDTFFTSKRRAARLVLTRDKRTGVVECWHFKMNREFDDCRNLPVYYPRVLHGHCYGGIGCAASERYPVDVYEAECVDYRLDEKREWVRTSDDPMVVPWKLLKRGWGDWLSWRKRLILEGRSLANLPDFRADMIPGADDYQGWGWWGLLHEGCNIAKTDLRRVWIPDLDSRWRHESACDADEAVFSPRMG